LRFKLGVKSITGKSSKKIPLVPLFQRGKLMMRIVSPLCKRGVRGDFEID
jgi:hypothetical protein